MCVIGPQSARRLRIFKQALGVMLLLGAVVFLPIVSNSWESDFGADAMFGAMVALSLWLICMTCWLWLTFSCRPHFSTLSYWTSHLTRCERDFPSGEAEKRLLKKWAWSVYKTKEATYSEAYLAYLEYQMKEAVPASLDEQIATQGWLACLQGEVEMWRKEFDRAHTFFFCEWPFGSGILDEDDRDGGRPSEWETEPENPIIQKVTA